MSGSGYASTRPGKAATVEAVTGLLEKSNFIFSLPSSGISANEVLAAI